MLSKLFLFFLGLFVVSVSCKSQGKSSYSLSFEKLDTDFKPIGWISSYGPQNNGYLVQIDSAITEQGKYSLSIVKSDSTSGTFGVCAYVVPASFEGSKIKLTGYVKSQNVTEGSARLYISIDNNESKQMAVEFTPILITPGWKEYSVEIPYNPKESKQIVIGAGLNGPGKIWIDNLHLFVDGKPLD